MITIGLRAAPKAVTFAIFDSIANRLVNVEEIIVPVAFDTPSALKYICRNIFDTLREYKVEKAGIRATEPSSPTKSTERVQIEGVIQEAFASSGLSAYYVGYASSISSRAGLGVGGFKRAIESKESKLVDNWGGMSKEQKEAILCAMGAVSA